MILLVALVRSSGSHVARGLVIWFCGAHILPLLGTLCDLHAMLVGSSVVASGVMLLFFGYWFVHVWVFFVWGATLMAHVTHFLLSARPTLVIVCEKMVLLVGYYCWLERFCLWPFLRVEGIPLLHPVVVLSQHALMTKLIVTYGLSSAYCAWCLVSMVGAFLLVNAQYRYYILLLVLMGIPDWIYRVPVKSDDPMVNQVVGSSFKGGWYTQNNSRLVKQFQLHLASIQNRVPFCQLVCTAEGALDGGAWGSTGMSTLCALPDPVPMVIVGGYCVDDGNRYGQVTLFYDGVYQDRYKKAHSIPFLEQTPGWCCGAVQRLYQTDTDGIVAASNKRPVWKLAESGSTIVPYICSELFCTVEPPGGDVNTIVAVMVNDAWNQIGIMKQLMLLMARLRALSWRRRLIYVSGSYAVWFDDGGREIKLIIC